MRVQLISCNTPKPIEPTKLSLTLKYGSRVHLNTAKCKDPCNSNGAPNDDSDEYFIKLTEVLLIKLLTE